MTINKWQVVDAPSSKWPKRLRADVNTDSKDELKAALINYEYPTGTVITSKDKDYKFSFYIYNGEDPSGNKLKEVLSGKNLPKKKPEKEKSETEKQLPVPSGISEEEKEDVSAKPSESPHEAAEDIYEEPAEEETPGEREEKPVYKIKEEGGPSEEDREEAEPPAKPAESSEEIEADIYEEGPAEEEAPGKTEEKPVYEIKEEGGPSEEDREEAEPPAKPAESSEEIEADIYEEGPAEEETAGEPSAPETDKKVLRDMKLGIIYSLQFENIKIETNQKPGGPPPTKKVYDIFIDSIKTVVSRQNIKVNFKFAYKMGYNGIPDKTEVLQKQKKADVLVIIDQKDNLEKLESVFKQEKLYVYTMPLEDIRKSYEYLNLAADIALRVKK
ncbi:MAG: hypothetical protein U9R36_05190 [Elusimicrobiota bacterium]|nr:hypothetical protein [Elusimicrobiota bacterium]